jgi:hypothetical protein
MEKSVAQRGWTMAQALVHRAREASLRLAQILDRNRPAATQVSRPVMGLICGLVVLCVTAASYAPQFVTIDRNGPVTSSEGAAQPAIAIAPTLSGASDAFSPGVPVVQATWHGDAAQPKKIHPNRTKAIAARSATPRTTNTLKAESTMAASDLAIVPWLEVNAIARGDDATPLQTLVFVQSARYLESDAGVVWRVQVWHITVIKPESRQLPTVPAAHST